MGKFILNLKKTWKYAKREKFHIILYIIFSVFITFISIFVPILSAKIIINLTTNKFQELLLISFIVLIIEVCRNFLIYFSQTLGQLIYRNILVKIQIKMGKEVLKLNNNTLIENGSGVFNQRINMDTARISDLFTMILGNVMNILTKVGIFIAIFIINKLVFLFMLLLIVLSYCIDNIRTSIKTTNLEKRKNEQEKVSSFSTELCRGAKDIRMLSSEKSFINEYQKRVESLNDKTLLMMNEDRKYHLINGCISDIGNFSIILLLIYLINNTYLSISLAVVLFNYKNQVNSIIYYINQTLENIKEYILSSERVFDIIDGKHFEKEKFGELNIKQLKGNIEFKNVNFAYKNRKVLNNLSFKITKGQTIAIVGKSGEGKTTILNVLCKFYDVDNDMIFLDDIDINKLSRKTIRDNMTIISQDPYIFNMTIRENFELVKEGVSLEKIKEVCEISCLKDFIESLPDKYDTVIGEGGINLSGGQKQRIAIARALLQDTRIILFDEATSSLDNETQRKIQEAVNCMKGNYTILIIAHRFSTVINSDEIFFIEDGRILSSGTHEELLEKCESYRKLYKAEFIK